MTSVWIRALLYLLIAAGGGWLVILPAGLLLLERGTAWPLWNSLAFRAIGVALFTVGFGLASWAGYCLIQIGHGTPLPLDRPRRLVTCGPYHRVRNPQAIAMMRLVAGEVLAIRSAWLWLLLPATLAYLELLVGPWEERQLARDFGTAYTAYVRQVPKWLPRRAGHGSAESSAKVDRGSECGDPLLLQREH
jgi:protein-S-isoprenylcysteine O-methyltransferase Ste14